MMQSVEELDKLTDGVAVGNACGIAKKGFGLSEISPTWYSRLGRLPGGPLDQFVWQIQLSSFHSCIVGEAYGFSS